jgi:DNA-binding NarL/FixJ family response regulator
MAQILIVDDHPLVRAGFAQLIGDTPDLKVCGEAADMATALKLIESITPDLAIIDLSLAWRQRSRPDRTHQSQGQRHADAGRLDA